MTQHEHIVKPEQSFDPIRLDNENFPSAGRAIIADPLGRFVNDRFRSLTSRQQAQLLGEIDLAIIKSGSYDPAKPPFQIEEMRALSGLRDNQRITQRVAESFYLDYSSAGRRLWLERLMREPETREMVTDKILAQLSTNLPAIPYTLAHIYEGGYYGLLTARGARENHAQQVRVISETFGYSPQLELVYYVNDEKLGKRLAGGSADKKATVLVNFANGLKEDEQGRLVPMTLGKPFDEIIFIDDEDKNLKAVMNVIVRDVCSNVLYEAGLRARTPWFEARITEKAKQISEEAYAKSGVAATQDWSFWRKTVDALLADLKGASPQADTDTVMASLIKQGKWLPDVLKVLDGRNISAEDSERRLRAALSKDEPLVLGSKRSVIFNDIDGNLLSVNARFYVTQKSDPDHPNLLVLDQAQFAEHPTPGHWIDIVSKKTGIPAGDLDFSFEHFRDPEAIERDILRAMYKGKITDNPYKDRMH